MSPADRYARCEAQILLYEGGFVNSPKDRGGPTNKGITLAALTTFLGRQASIAELQSMSDALVAAVYKGPYWNAVSGDDLPSGVDLMAFDSAVNCGRGHAARWLQGAVGVVQDRDIGPATLAAVTAADDRVTISRMADAREAYYRALPDPGGFPTFGKGWISRLTLCEAKATAWVMPRSVVSGIDATKAAIGDA